MKRFGQFIGLDRSRLEEYERYHAAIWPDIAHAIHRAGIRNYSIFYRDGKLFGYYEYVGPEAEYDARMQALSEAPRMREWWALMGPMQRPEANRAEGEWWADMEEVFHLNGTLAPGLPPDPPLTQRWPMPTKPRPIVSIGTGGIFRDAHAPAYRAAGLAIRGVYDVDPDVSGAAAQRFDIPDVYTSLERAFGVPEAVFDIAVPGQRVREILERAPRGASVLIQKPMGDDLAEARRLLQICRDKDLVAAINFQLRFSPNMLAIRDALRRGLFGGVTDVEVRVNLHTPWELWPFLSGLPRLEVLYHSIHYLDLIRSLLGDPQGVYCRGVGRPETPALADTRTTTILDYGDALRCSLVTNHTHRFGARHAVSQLKLEGVAGAAQAKMGVNLAYPQGERDELELCLSPGADAEWMSVPLVGSWFTEAFAGPMCNLQRYAAGEDDVLLTGVEDAIRTMALVEACYESSAGGATPIPSDGESP